MHRVGILLAGCGAHDGSDIHETVLAALALERALLRPVYFAPADVLGPVVDHASGAEDPASGSRSVLVESARLARGRVEPFDPASASDVAALVIPGGLGLLRHLMQDVLVPGKRARIAPQAAAVFTGLRARGVPFATIGLAHVLLEALGEPLPVDPLTAAPDRAVADPARGLAWTPGFLGAHGLDEAARGIGALVDALAPMLGRRN